MRVRLLALAAAALSATAIIPSAAMAQTKVYVIDEAKIRDGSKIGADIRAKLGAIEQEGIEKLGLKALSDQIEAESTRLQPQLQTMVGENGQVAVESLEANPTLKSQVEALGQKQIELRQKSSVLSQNLDQQQSVAMAAFTAALAPAVNHVAAQEGADVVLSVASTWYVKDTIDLSAKVIQRLDATTPTLASLEAALKPPAQ